MRRTLYVSLVGLTIAFAVFYAFGWPSTLSAGARSPVVMLGVKAEETVHVALGPFAVTGRHAVNVSTARLEDPSVGIELVAISVSRVGDAGAVTIDQERGDRPEIEALPSAPGFVLHPGDGGYFVVTFKVPSTTAFGFRGLRVTYSSGWLTRSTLFGPAVSVNPAPTPIASPTPTPTRS